MMRHYLSKVLRWKHFSLCSVASMDGDFLLLLVNRGKVGECMLVCMTQICPNDEKVGPEPQKCESR